VSMALRSTMRNSRPASPAHVRQTLP
jgi:hypothetical protein